MKIHDTEMLDWLEQHKMQLHDRSGVLLYEQRFPPEQGFHPLRELANSISSMWKEGGWNDSEILNGIELNASIHVYDNAGRLLFARAPGASPLRGYITETMQATEGPKEPSK